ncbi:MAG: ABC transporter, partial [Mycobacterium leprae]
PDFDGLVLLDLPDHDSTEVSHRLEVDRLVERVDLMVWVLDPQKYADALVHEHYLRRLARHEPVLLVVLNQVDLLDADSRARCLTDVRRLLREDGLGNVPIVATSTVTGDGLPELRGILAARVAARRAAVERLAADVDAAAERLRTLAGGTGARIDTAAGLDPAAHNRLTDALSDAAGVPAVTAAVAAAYRARAVQAAGWPPARWLRRLRPDPLRRLHLGLGTGRGDDRVRSSLPPPGPGARAVAEAAVRDAAATLVAGLPEPWPTRARAGAVAQAAELPDRLDRAVAGTDLGMAPPAWWRLLGITQWVLTLVAIAGALWLLALAGLGWLRLPAPDPPQVGMFPLPTVLLVGGVLAGWLLAILARRLAALGARRRARRARSRLRAAIETVTEAAVQPVLTERRAYAEMQRALDRALGA